jgi:hypothetical protein
MLLRSFFRRQVENINLLPQLEFHRGLRALEWAGECPNGHEEKGLPIPRTLICEVENTRVRTATAPETGLRSTKRKHSKGLEHGASTTKSSFLVIDFFRLNTRTC